jgi:hypothetical protein
MRVTYRTNWLGINMIGAAIFGFFPSTTIEAQPSSADEAALRRYGHIIIPSEIKGQCRTLRFDNSTGMISESSPDKCPKGWSADELNSSENRITTIRRSFSGR